MKNIVLVHGAWADGSGWRGVYDNLVGDGFNVSIVQEPETSFKEDVAATKRVLAQQDGPCILVAHSYGGAIITEVSSVSRLLVIQRPSPAVRDSILRKLPCRARNREELPMIEEQPSPDVYTECLREPASGSVHSS